MFNVSLLNLSADARVASPRFGPRELGEVSEADLVALLESFSLLPTLQVHESEPEITVETHLGKYIVRTGQGKLFLYDARDNAEPYAELSALEIARQISGAELPVPADDAPGTATPSRTPHRGIAIGMLAAGLCLNGYTLYSVFYIDDVNQKPAIKVITDAIELSARQAAVVGRYATGGEPGDRYIVVGSDGRVRFGEVSAGRGRPESSDMYRIGRYDEQLCLTTPDSGVIDITGLNTLVYYRDIYRRTK